MWFFFYFGRFNPSGTEVKINQHKSIEERIEAANDFKKTFELENEIILLDTMQNNYMEKFSAWPLRYHSFKGLEVDLIGMPEKDKFTFKDLKDYLQIKQTLHSHIERINRLALRMLHFSSGRYGYGDYDFRQSRRSKCQII